MFPERSSIMAISKAGIIGARASQRGATTEREKEEDDRNRIIDIQNILCQSDPFWPAAIIPDTIVLMKRIAVKARDNRNMFQLTATLSAGYPPGLHCSLHWPHVPWQ